MIATCGDEYRGYQSHVPMFLPRRGEWRRLIDAAQASMAA
jgi:hypothetical protein